MRKRVNIFIEITEDKPVGDKTYTLISRYGGNIFNVTTKQARRIEKMLIRLFRILRQKYNGK